MNKTPPLVALVIFSAIFVFSCGGMSHSTTQIATLVNKPDDGTSYVYVAFEVPEGVKSIAVSLDYDSKNGKNRLELGLFDERFSGSKSDKMGLRGWSGSIREGFFIAEDRATSGYQKGKINPGKWFIILGTADIEERGVMAKLKIDFDLMPKSLEGRFTEESRKVFAHKSLKTSSANGWLRGDLHTHTFHSDGRWSVKGILDSAEARGLDFISITDHNTFSHHAEIDVLRNKYPGLLILNGEEVTTYGGHANVWGLKTGDWVDFRVIPGTPESAKRIADEAHAFGALASINHPTMDCGGCGWTYGDWTQMDSVEVWNAAWDEQDEQALMMWDKLLQEGKRITAIGSSDTHQPPYEPSDYPTNRAAGSPTVFLKSGRSQKELFEAIKEGRVYVAADPELKVNFWVDDPKFIAGSEPETISPGSYALKSPTGKTVVFGLNLEGFVMGSKVRLISFDGREIALIEKVITKNAKADFREQVRVVGNGYVRIEIRNPDGSMAAFTNPIWVEADD